MRKAIAEFKGTVQKIPRGKMTDMPLTSWKEQAAIRRQQLKFDDAPKA
jgi:hypothetical protein